MQISVARAFWRNKVSEGWIVVTKTDNRISVQDDIRKKEKEWLDKFIDQHLKPKKDMHSLYMKNKKKHDKDFYKYDNYALEA